MIAGHALKMPLPLTYYRIIVDCTSGSGAPSFDRKIEARIVCLRSDEPDQSLRGTAVPLPPQPLTPNTVQLLFNRLLAVHARREDLFATLR